MLSLRKKRKQFTIKRISSSLVSYPIGILPFSFVSEKHNMKLRDWIFELEKRHSKILHTLQVRSIWQNWIHISLFILTCQKLQRFFKKDGFADFENLSLHNSDNFDEKEEDLKDNDSVGFFSTLWDLTKSHQVVRYILKYCKGCTNTFCQYIRKPMMKY